MGGNLFDDINFPRAFISVICDEDDMVSPKHDGDDDGKTVDVPAYVLLASSDFLAVHFA